MFVLKAHRLSTLCLQNDKRMDDELRGGKRKIKLVQEQVRAALNRRNSLSLIIIISCCRCACAFAMLRCTYSTKNKSRPRLSSSLEENVCAGGQSGQQGEDVPGGDEEVTEPGQL